MARLRVSRIYLSRTYRSSGERAKYLRAEIYSFYAGTYIRIGRLLPERRTRGICSPAPTGAMHRLRSARGDPEMGCIKLFTSAKLLATFEIRRSHLWPRGVVAQQNFPFRLVRL